MKTIFERAMIMATCVMISAAAMMFILVTLQVEMGLAHLAQELKQISGGL